MIGFALSFEGRDADEHELDFYDAAQAMLGFQRSLAITTHLVLNGQVITQAPSLKNARIVAVPPEDGSWKISAIITSIALSAYGIGTAPKDTPLGHIVHSAYDYVISESLGFHVDYEKSLGQQYQQLQKSKQNQLPILDQSKFDSAIEKCESAIREMHRPIVKSETADSAHIIYRTRTSEQPLDHPLNTDTYGYISETTADSQTSEIEGRISSYNINTYKGRMFISAEKRPLPFELAEAARTPEAVRRITDSLSENAMDRFSERANISCAAFKNWSKTGRLKSLFIVEVI